MFVTEIVQVAAEPLAIVCEGGLTVSASELEPPPPPPPPPEEPPPDEPPPLAPTVGVTAFEGTEAGPVPAALVAVTVNVYPVPFVNPVTVIGLPVPLAVSPPGDDVTVYEVIVVPPLEAGASKLTVACPSPALAAAPVGAEGGAV